MNGMKNVPQIALSSLLFLAIAYHVYFVTRTIGTQTDISFIVNQKSIYSYLSIYLLNISVFYIIIFIIKNLIYLTIHSERYFVFDSIAIIAGALIIVTICILNGIPFKVG
jgi:hypothetical protein